MTRIALALALLAAACTGTASPVVVEETCAGDADCPDDTVCMSADEAADSEHFCATPVEEDDPVSSATAGSTCSCIWVLGTSHYHCTVNGATRCYGACPG